MFGSAGAAGVVVVVGVAACVFFFFFVLSTPCSVIAIFCVPAAGASDLELLAAGAGAAAGFAGSCLLVPVCGAALVLAVSFFVVSCADRLPAAKKPRLMSVSFSSAFILYVVF